RAAGKALASIFAAAGVEGGSTLDGPQLLVSTPGAALQPSKFGTTLETVGADAVSSLHTLPSAAVDNHRITFREEGERVVAFANHGELLLDVSLNAGIPHFHACGGKARCSTCRVVVLEG